MKHIFELIEEVQKDNAHPIMTGFKFLDEALGGYYPGEVTTICGGENCGKSAFIVTQLNRIAVEQHIPTLLVLNNMSVRNFLSAMAAYYCDIEATNLHSILESEEHKDVVGEYLMRLGDSPLYVVEAQLYEDKSFFDQLDKIIADESIKMVFFDEAITDDSSVEKGLVNHLKRIALRHHIPVVASCCVWNSREGLAGIAPELVDLDRCCGLHENDVVIGFTNYEPTGITIDERGRDLHETLVIDILKHKGKAKAVRYLLPFGYLQLRNYKHGHGTVSLEEFSGLIDVEQTF